MSFGGYVRALIFQVQLRNMKMNCLIRNLGLALYLIFLLTSNDAYALTLTPVKVEIAGDPGQTLSGEIDLYNEQADGKLFYISYENFEPGNDEDGSPKFVGGGSDLATWIQTDASVSIVQNEKKTIPYSITIPKDALPGGYFGAIFFGGQNPSVLENGQVSVGGKLGTLILLTVRGGIENGAGIIDFKANYGRVSVSVPVSFTFRISKYFT